jgi:hypothetical protein
MVGPTFTESRGALLGGRGSHAKTQHSAMHGGLGPPSPLKLLSAAAAVCSAGACCLRVSAGAAAAVVPTSDLEFCQELVQVGIKLHNAGNQGCRQATRVQAMWVQATRLQARTGCKRQGQEAVGLLSGSANRGRALWRAPAVVALCRQWWQPCWLHLECGLCFHSRAAPPRVRCMCVSTAGMSRPVLAHL